MVLTSCHPVVSVIIRAICFKGITNWRGFMSDTKDLNTRSEFESALSAAVLEFSMLKHPFYVAWSEGKLTKEILGEYAKQYYAHVKAFPTYVSGVHSQCEDVSIRQQLLENLIEEERGEDNHPELWLR